ncbi:hypothetical protein AXE65_12195 [Ventosimonas gracilis]|uniref:Negative regulator of flagellin synthesis n=1 Tax=Ventosimonas gracilis TaxID=1680762 RepID=A0A139SW71_9GAMM|nr:flagellar biosynthesis anti-sigma factor FlgM [Ventosimonas gracilis]KXU38744.1 hypothetical protein AXE65_12195 [Ventosimonas gracilis]
MSTPISAPANQPINGIARIRPTGFATDNQAAVNRHCCQARGETVELSQQAQTLQQVSACQCAQPVVDQSRVERLREAIENGGYSIDSQRLASKMLAFERDL